MMGNFSFGDYFKAEAIPWAWELVTEVWGLDPDRLWVTVHETDDEAADIWRDVVGVPPERIQRLGDKSNLWSMADTGPCGYNSEIFFDISPELGPGRWPGRSTRTATSRSGTSCSCSTTRSPTARVVPLPKPSIDTGAGIERCLAALQGVEDGVGDRADAAAHRGGRGAHRRDLRRLSRHRPRRVAAHPRRARALDRGAHRRRCGAVERRARLRAAAHHPARGAPRVPARRARPRHADDGRRRGLVTRRVRIRRSPRTAS